MTWVALDCLQLHLARFRQVQPAHPVETEKAFQKRPEAERKNYMLEPWDANPPLIWPKVRDLGPPRRGEVNSVSYELWLLQLYDDIKTAATHSMLGWPTEDVEALNPDGRNGSPWRKHDSQSQVLNYLQEAHGQSSPAAVCIPWERLQARQREGPAPPMRDRAIGVARGIYRKSNALAPYEHLGFGCWCFERMRLAGFFSHARDHCEYATFKYHCAWLSVLGPEDVAKVVEKRRAAAEQERKNDELSKSGLWINQLYLLLRLYVQRSRCGLCDLLHLLQAFQPRIAISIT